MLAYSLSSNTLKCITILVFFAHAPFTKGAELYDFRSKKTVEFTSLLEKSTNYVLLIDEKCNVCESLLSHKVILKKQKLIIGVVNEPSFKWLAKLSMRYDLKKVYDLKSLGVDYKKGTPQLFSYDSDGKLLSEVYGKSNILKQFTPKL